MAQKRSSSSPSGNYKIALYDDSSSSPNALLGSTASTALAAANDYSYIPLTADAIITTATIWLAFKSDNGAGNHWRRNADASSTMKYHGSGITYSDPFENPASGLSTSASDGFVAKAKGA